MKQPRLPILIWHTCLKYLDILFNFEFVTYYFTYLLLKIRMLLKKRILYLSPIERKSWLFSTFSWSKKDGLLISERCIFSFASRFITNWTTPLFFAILGNINDRGHSTMGSNCFYNRQIWIVTPLQFHEIFLKL